MMVPLGEVGVAFSLVALGCASVGVVDVRLTVEPVRGDDGEVRPAVAIKIITADQKNASVLASLLDLKPTFSGAWSGMVTSYDALLPASCTVDPWRTTTPSPRGDGALQRQAPRRAAS